MAQETQTGTLYQPREVGWEGDKKEDEGATKQDAGTWNTRVILRAAEAVHRTLRDWI